MKCLLGPIAPLNASHNRACIVWQVRRRSVERAFIAQSIVTHICLWTPRHLFCVRSCTQNPIFARRELGPRAGAAAHMNWPASLLAGFCALYRLRSSRSRSAAVPSPITSHFNLNLLHSFPLDLQSFALVGQFASTPQPNRIGFLFRPHLFFVDFDAVPDPRQP